MPSPSKPADGLRIGYGRKSKDDQDLALQRDALERAGCSQIYTEQVSRAGPRRARKGTPELDKVLGDVLRPGDTFVVWRLDRLGGSVSELIRIVNDLADRNIGFESLTEKIDTSTAAGNMFFQIAAVFAEYERRLLIERTVAGLEAARARGRKGGRRPAMNEQEIREAKALLADPEITVADVCKRFGVSRTTLYTHVGSVRPLRRPEEQGSS